MARGGRRSRSGPPIDPNSGRSEARGIKFTNLPAAGNKGRAPRWPLDEQSAREKVVWREIWKTPQADQWSKEKLWRLRPVALFVRWSVRAEAGDCSAAVLSQVNRLADQLGLTPAGIRENGWKIVDVIDATASQPTELGVVRELQPRRPLTMDGES